MVGASAPTAIILGYWDFNDPNVDQTEGLPTTGGVRLSDDEDSPMIGGGGLPAVDQYPLPKRLRERMKKAYMIAGLGEDNMIGTVTMRKGKIKIEYDSTPKPNLCTS